MAYIPDKFERFEAWLRENGAHFEALELREYDCLNSSNTSASEVDDEEKKESPLTVSLEEVSEMRGVHARRSIPPHTTCVSIPRRCLITVEMGQATPIGRAILQADLDLDAPKHIFLMIYLLWDRKTHGSSSFFHPYYEILPPTLRNMPIFWSAFELQELEGSHLLSQIADRGQAIQDDYEAILEVAPSLGTLCTLDEFKWARMCVCSRNFGLQIDGHRTSALVPHADMLNHYRPRETKWTFDEVTQCFTITSLQSIQAGAQVYDSYGQKCNHRFLLNYGFAVEDNRELDGFCPNEVPLELYVDPADILFQDKLEFWTRGETNQISGAVTAGLIAQAVGGSMGRGVPSHAAESYTSGPVVKRVRVCVSNNENTRLLFSLLRALACNETELSAIASPVSNDGVTRALFGLGAPQPLSGSRNHPFAPSLSYHRSCRDIRHPISLRNERASMKLLLSLLHRQLASYPTTISQDMADLQDEASYPQFSNRRHAKIQVRGEKEVLHHFRVWSETALDMLTFIEDELKEQQQGNVEVELLQNNRTSVTTTGQGVVNFDDVIRDMEQDDDVHHTILRYCADVLGSLRREEFKHLRYAQEHASGTRGGARSSFRSNNGLSGFF
jgi:histone-lysine N-methyltransferase SETD3